MFSGVKFADPPSSAKRILFVASYPDQPIGYSKIAHILSNALADSEVGFEVYYFGFANFEATKLNDRQINPNIRFIDAVAEERILGNHKELYGVNVFPETIKRVNPDYLFIYNDCIVVSRLFNSLIESNTVKTFKTIVYLDLVYDYQCPEFLQHIYNMSDRLLVFSEHWKDNLKKTLRNYGDEYDGKVGILNHGFNREVFFKRDKVECRKEIGIEEDDFVFLNINRNNYRKGWDRTFSAFFIFLRKHNYNPKIKLYVHTGLVNDAGYNFMRTIEISARAIGIPNDMINIIINTNIIKYDNSGDRLPDSAVNTIYNACDVGLNTCIGEGFGLCNLEHAILGAPQIVSKVGGLCDVFGGFGDTAFVKPSAWYQVSTIADEHTGFAGVVSPEDVADKMEDVYNNYNSFYSDIYTNTVSKSLYDRYDWSIILDQFKAYFN